MDNQLITQGYRLYSGDNIDIYFNTELCQHSGNCIRGNPALFKLSRKPWIAPDNVTNSEVKRVIDTCPSGALQYRDK